MSLFKNIKEYFKKKNVLKHQLEHSIPNFENYNPSNKTIVFICRNMPTPDKDSGSNRLKEIIISFQELGFNCVICSKNAYRTDEYMSYFSTLGIITYVESNQFENYFAFLKSIPKVDYVWFNGPNELKKNLKKINYNLPSSKTIYDMVDIHFLRYQRAIALDPTRISLRKKYLKYLEIETKFSKQVDYVIAISEIEKEIMSQYVNSNKIITISNIHYPKIKKEECFTFENRKDLLLTGSTHAPNIDSIHYLYNEIMPLVWKKLPDVKVIIIGNVIDKIGDIQDSNFIFKGYVPDIEPFFISSKMMIAPLRFGAGVKGKIGQAFEYYLPVVTTSIGAEGMNLTNRKNVLIEDSSEGFASAIVELYTNKELWQKLQNQSEKNLEPFSRERVKNVIGQM
ncbi:glycosyltransferase [Flavobacterium sp.]|jgi:glycosyltransferase involved in cell wall biosynthesis|uniref:glycosyltransferase n=1 Tax=Flavobacterium sp. TaxID=239 RepID=UPI0037C060B8